MERIQALINRLQDQLDQKADPAQMQATVQWILAELSQQSASSKILGTTKVAVIMPQVHPEPVKKETKKKESKEPVQHHSRQQHKQEHQLGFEFDPMTEIPTLSHQRGTEQSKKAFPEQEISLNDRFNEKRTELMETLKDEPIRDLRKAIGINDRYIFIQELFRGDESMYDRCVKTINGFSIFAEAEYWMNRELIVKLGWNEEDAIVRGFYSLVKRRFS